MVKSTVVGRKVLLGNHEKHPQNSESTQISIMVSFTQKIFTPINSESNCNSESRTGEDLLWGRDLKGILVLLFSLQHHCILIKAVALHAVEPLNVDSLKCKNLYI